MKKEVDVNLFVEMVFTKKNRYEGISRTNNQSR